MRSRRAIPAVATVVATLAGLACADDPITRPRADSGTLVPDGGMTGPLALTEGMTFTYRATLTRRERDFSEKNSAYTIKLTINEADDNGNTAESTLEIGAVETDPRVVDEWMEPFDYDSWIGRLGPSLRDDVLGATATAHLSKSPEIPPPPTPAKMLPAPDTFFLDVRKMDQIRSAFQSAYATRMPQTQDPSTSGPCLANRPSCWRFAFSGVDDTIVFYDIKSRNITIAYDPLGFLISMSEDIGNSQMPPFAHATLTLLSGP